MFGGAGHLAVPVVGRVLCRCVYTIIILRSNVCWSHPHLGVCRCLCTPTLPYYLLRSGAYAVLLWSYCCGVDGDEQQMMTSSVG